MIKNATSDWTEEAKDLADQMEADFWMVLMREALRICLEDGRAEVEKADVILASKMLLTWEARRQMKA